MSHNIPTNAEKKKNQTQLNFISTLHLPKCLYQTQRSQNLRRGPRTIHQNCFLSIPGEIVMLLHWVRKNQCYCTAKIGKRSHHQRQRALSGQPKQARTFQDSYNPKTNGNYLQPFRINMTSSCSDGHAMHSLLTSMKLNVRWRHRCASWRMLGKWRKRDGKSCCISNQQF